MMRIARQTDGEMVVEESSLGIAALLAAVSLPFFYQEARGGGNGNLITALFLLVCSLVWVRRSRFVFDSGRQAVEWKRLRFFRTASGTIPFREILGIRTESTCGRSGASRVYRLSIATAGGCVPMTDSYGSGRRAYEVLQQEIVRFIGPGIPALEGSVRGLLSQGRKADAIALLGSSAHLDPAMATQRVNQMLAEMQARRAG